MSTITRTRTWKTKSGEIKTKTYSYTSSNTITRTRTWKTKSGEIKTKTYSYTSSKYNYGKNNTIIKAGFKLNKKLTESFLKGEVSDRKFVNSVLKRNLRYTSGQQVSKKAMIEELGKHVTQEDKLEVFENYGRRLNFWKNDDSLGVTYKDRSYKGVLQTLIDKLPNGAFNALIDKLTDEEKTKLFGDVNQIDSAFVYSWNYDKATQKLVSPDGAHKLWIADDFSRDYSTTSIAWE